MSDDATDSTTEPATVEAWRLTGREDLEAELLIRSARVAALQRPAEATSSC